MTQKTILDAKLDGRQIEDGEFQAACSNACSSGAITFGDVNDKSSKIAMLREEDRMYHLLESVGTKPNVMYQTKVRNVDQTQELENNRMASHYEAPLRKPLVR